MMCNPLESTVARSPSQTPLLAYATRFTKPINLAYADTLDGYFAVLARPSMLDPVLVTTNPANRLPAVGQTSLLGDSFLWQYQATHGDAGFPATGAVRFHDDAYDQRVVWVTGLTDSAATTHTGIHLKTDSASVIKVRIYNNSTTSHEFKLMRRLEGGLWTSLTVNPVSIGRHQSVELYSSNPATNGSALTIFMCDSSGTPKNPEHTIELEVSFDLASAAILDGTISGSVGSFVQRKFVDQAHISNCRVSAMSMLVTNMGAATHDGGELVIADTRQSIMFRSSSTANLMENIKSLPEGNRWHSGVMRNGGYTFYAPDDMESYEPSHYDNQHLDDNCCIAAGRLDVDGKVRIMCTFVVEFYTPAQVFDRSLGPTWTREYKLALAMLQTGRMASGNEDHETMTKRIANTVAKAWKWAWENKEFLEAGGQIALALL
jgi:hypothetical protein